MNESSEDYHNFTQSSPEHRLPALNGAEALLGIATKLRPISTGLKPLDTVLTSLDTALRSNGIVRGQLTELYGPPGSGKTHLAVSVLSNALSADTSTRVTWIDTSAELCRTRIDAFVRTTNGRQDMSHSHAVNGSACASPDRELNGVSPRVNDAHTHPSSSADVGGAVLVNEHNVTENGTDGKIADNALERIHYRYVSILPFLLAVLQTPDDIIFPETALLVIDDFSEILLAGLPQNNHQVTFSAGNALSAEEILAKDTNKRRAALISAVATDLAKLAASRSIAIVVCNKARTHRRNDARGTFLQSALHVKQWNDCVSTRIAICREFWPVVDKTSMTHQQKSKLRKRERHRLRVAYAEKIDGKQVCASGVPFVILESRLQSVDHSGVDVSEILPRSTPDDDENEEAMGNLGLEDTEDTLEAGLTTAEDAIPSSAVQKRKLEVADSEDEDEISIGPARAYKIGRSTSIGFTPSSQIAPRLSQTGADSKVEEEEMLLKD